MTEFLLKLFVVGQTARSQRAIANLRQICERALPERYELIIIDVLESPGLAENEHILATPTLVKVSPPPQRRIIGDLSDYERVLWGLGIQKEESIPASQGGMIHGH